MFSIARIRSRSCDGASLCSLARMKSSATASQSVRRCYKDALISSKFKPPERLPHLCEHPPIDLRVACHRLVKQQRLVPKYSSFLITNRLINTPVIRRYAHLLNLNDYNRLICRNFATEPDKQTENIVRKGKTGRVKVDSMMKVLKEELEAGQREAERIEAAKKSALELQKKPIKERVWNELVHYYHGFKLFLIDLKVSTRLVWRLARGHTLNRQEKLQLVRSAADLFRLVPFLVFVVVPFMEFLLPVYLKLFPGALPSTFQEQSREDEKARKQLKLKRDMAKFLQETVEELASERKKKDAADTKITEFSTFLKNIREGGGYVSNVQLLNYSKLFEDELTLDNLSEAQLRALCRIVGITPMGTANILRFQLSRKLNELKSDDRVIYKEGVENLSVSELQAACRARGMRAMGLSEERLRQQLDQWLELSFNEKVPPSLLLLSSTLYLPEEVAFGDRLKTLISTLPAHLADDVKLKIAEAEGAADNKSKFELVKSIEEILKRDRENRKALKKAAEANEAKKQLEDKAKDLSISAPTDQQPVSSISDGQATANNVNKSKSGAGATNVIGDNMNGVEIMQAQKKKDANP